jgi:hypothetical protein
MLTLGFCFREARAPGCVRMQALSDLTSTDTAEINAPRLANVDESYEGPIAYPLPSKPFKDQAAAPCRPKAGEVEINGGCWVELAWRPPCTELQAEFQGKCYLPTSKKQDREPRSSHP